MIIKNGIVNGSLRVIGKLFADNIEANTIKATTLEGTATTATALTSKSIGSATKPVYFDANGKPVAISYTISKSVPSDAKFTDTTYANFVKSGSGAKAGLVPAPPATAGTSKFLREDCTWQTISMDSWSDTEITNAINSNASKVYGI